MSCDVQETAGGLRISRRSEGGVTVLQLTGERDIASTPQLSSATASAFGGGARPVVLEMAGVGLLDSTGVRMLRAARHLAGRELVLMAPSRAVTRVFDLTRRRGSFVEIDADADRTTPQR
jgi:anti-sigma B factor antagonist